MADIPILFSTAMVKALLAGTKCQTRRVLKPQPPVEVTGAGRYGSTTTEGFWKDEWNWITGDPTDIDGWDICGDLFKTGYNVGDRLWVRESWQAGKPALPSGEGLHPLIEGRPTPGMKLVYRADGDDFVPPMKWRPSIHMPRWASRLTLTVTDVKVERVQDITEEDAKEEGVPEPYIGDGDPPFEYRAITVTRRMQFRNLWNDINDKRGYGWDANPWVVAVALDVRKGNIDG